MNIIEKNVSHQMILDPTKTIFLGYNQLTSLIGSPKKTASNFYCFYNQLTNLVGAPEEVGGDFGCGLNNLTSLEGSPKVIGTGLECANNKLANLKDIHKHIKFIGGLANFLGNPIESHVVGLLLIDGLEHVYLDNKVSGVFSCSCNQLKSLKGAPKEVDGDFYCSNNQLTSLEHAPKKIGGGYFSCSNNQLTSLEGSPKEVNGDFSCSNNQLTSLEGGPVKVDGHCIYAGNSLESLTGVAETVGEQISLRNNKLKNLKDIHRKIKFIGGKYANFSNNPIESHVVGLLLIKGLTKAWLDNTGVETIINKHLKANKDVLACIEELEEAGYSEFAKI